MSAEFAEGAKTFLDKIFAKLKENKIQLEKYWNIDHLCYRVSTLEAYETKKINFAQFATLLIESEVNGRMISTFKIKKPIIFRDWEIDIVELPAPKVGKTTMDGFEHIEVVVDVPFSEIKKRYSQVQFDESSLQKVFNQELEINFEGCALKFHYLSLESVVRLEHNTKVFSAIEKLGVLSEFRSNNPIVSGTFPLGLNIATSDVDILMECTDLNQFKNILITRYSLEKNFAIKKLAAGGEPSIVAEFLYGDVKFEIFAQNMHPVLQSSNRHFLVEERLLKLGKEPLRNKVLALKNEGIKTEPAFAKVLKITGDPYHGLDQLRLLSELELTKLIKR